MTLLRSLGIICVSCQANYCVPNKVSWGKQAGKRYIKRNFVRIGTRTKYDGGEKTIVSFICIALMYDDERMSEYLSSYLAHGHFIARTIDYLSRCCSIENNATVKENKHFPRQI